MSDTEYLQHETEYLRKRTWDFIAKLEKYERELQKTTDADSRQALLSRIKNTRRLHDNYLSEYNNLCQEANLTPENFAPNAPSRDIVVSLSRKAAKTGEELMQDQQTKLSPFFLVPSRNPKFTGRRDEVREFIERVLQGGAFAICGVKGMGGIGKSEIAKEVCHLFHQTWRDKPELPEYVADLLPTADGSFFRDGILWIQFEPESQTPKSLIKWLIPKLLAPDEAGKISDLDDLLKQLAEKDVLVVLDSVEQNLRTFDYVLECFKGKFPIIITSRVSIPGIHTHNIDVLKDEEAEALFTTHLPEPTVSAEQREGIRELCKLLGNFPLAIKIIASRVKPDLSNLAKLRSTYQENRALLLEESGHDIDIESRNADVKTCFMMSLKTLDELEQHNFLHTALFNNPFTASALAGLLYDADEEETSDLVKHLHRLSLVNCLEGKDEPTYELHPLMREFALDQLHKQIQILPEKKEKIAAFLKELKEANKHQNLLELLQDQAQVQQVIEAMQYCDQVFDFVTVNELMNVVNRPLDSLGYWDNKSFLNRLAIRSAVALQNPASEAHWRTQLAVTLENNATTRVELEATRKQLEHALRIGRRLHDTETIVFTRYRLACIEEILQRWPAAIHSHLLGIREACYYNQFYWMGAFVKCLGNVQKHFAGERTELFYYLNLKIKSNTSLGFNRENLLMAYADIADAKYARGQIKSLIPYYERQLSLAESLSSNQLYIMTVSDLFDCFLYLQKPEACRHYLDIYLKKSSHLDLAESRLQSIQGRYAWLTGNYSEAIQAFSTAMTQNDLEPEVNYYWLGKIHLYRGDLSRAAENLNKALEHHRAQKNAVEIAKVYSQLALLALKRGEVQTAAETFCIAAKTQQAHHIELSPEEQQIEQDIRVQLGDEPYAVITAQTAAIELQPDFLSPELPPPTYTSSDGKHMLLIPTGPAFIGKGTIESPDVEELLDNIEQHLFPYQQHSALYKIPPHPNVVFDEDKLLFLLEKNQIISEQQKQESLNKIPDMSESEVQGYIAILDQSYQEANPKATEIYLYPYYIDRDPVSNTEYAAFCLATDHPYPSHWVDDKYPQDTADSPVVNISLEDAKAYAAWADKEIPTAAEWEKACRGEQGTLYPWGDEWDESLVKAKDGGVGSQFQEEYLRLNDQQILNSDELKLKEEKIPAEIEKEFSELNATIPEQGGLIHFKTPIFTLPSHQLEVDEQEFVSYLQGSVSLRKKEKKAIIAKFSELTQTQLDELLNILKAEKEKFTKIDDHHTENLSRLRMLHYIELTHPELLVSEAHPHISDGDGIVRFKTPRYILPPHELILEDEFLSYLQGSLSLTKDEKRRVVNALPRLTQKQVDELMRILREEKDKFLTLDKQHENQLNQLRQNRYFELMESELAEAATKAFCKPAANESVFGVRDLIGSIYHLTMSERDGKCILKGGSWFSGNPKEACKGWSENTIGRDEKRMDVGFRCVKPAFNIPQ